MTSETAGSFSPKHHALLFAWITKAVFEQVGDERAKKIIRKAVRRYGEQRGGRMALRAEANGHKLSMVNFLAYGEWRAEAGEQNQDVIAKTPHLVAHVQKCPWHEAWAEYEVMDYGKLYCQEVDEALVRGFNPNLRIEVNATKSEGDEYCDFVFHDANLGFINSILTGYRKSVNPAESGVMSWEYHLGHLYTTVGEVMDEELGELGKETMEAALQEFIKFFGKGAGEVIRSYTTTDFYQLP